MLIKKTLVLVSALLIANPIVVYPAAIPGRMPATSHVSTAMMTNRAAATLMSSHPTPAVFNLGSANTTFSASSLVGNRPVAIMVGQTSRTVTAASELTAAEFIATYQVALQGRQTLAINKLGDAVGGTIKIDSALSGMLSGLNIPRGVTVVENVSGANCLDLSGNLVNAGSFYAFSSNPRFSTFSIAAANIDNLPGGLISTVLPAGLFAHAGISELDLSLSALGNILNAGIISSSGNLSIAANGSIANSLPANVSAGLPLLSAKNNVNLQSANIVNQGQVNAVTGNLLVTNGQGNYLMVNNSQGSMSAGNNLVFQNLNSVPGSQLPANLSITGGMLAANHVYFTVPGGVIAVNVDSIKGGVNVSGSTSAINVAGGTLTIESSQLTGDPIFSNATGNLDLAGLFATSNTFSTAGQDFVALAGGDILNSKQGGSFTIDATSGAGGIGGEFTLASGVTFNLTSGFEITGASKTGGSINLPKLTLQTTNNNISLSANAGSASSGDITTGSLTTGFAGNVSVASGSQGTVNFDYSTNVQGGNVDIRTGNLVDNGTIAATANNGSVNIHSPGALTLSGNPQNISVNPFGSGTITVAAAGANPLTVSSYTFSTGPTGSTILSAKDPGGSVVFADNAILYVYGGGYMSVVSPQVAFGQNSGILAVGASVIDINSGSQNQSVILPANSTVLLSTNGGNVQVGPYTNANLFISTAQGSTSQLFVNAGNLDTYSNGGNTTIGAGVTLATNENMQLHVDGGTLFDYGTVISSAYAGNVTISSQNGNLTLAGANAAVILSGGGPAALVLEAGGPNHTINMNSNYTVDAGAQGAATVNTTNFNLAANSSFTATDSSALSFNAASVSLGNKSTLSADAAGQAIYFNPGPSSTGVSLTVISPANGSATIASTSGGAITFSQDGLSFLNGGSKGSTVNFTGGPVNIGTVGDVTIGQGVALNSDNNITMAINSGRSLIDNGTIISTAVNGQINISGNTQFTMTGNPNYIAVTGGGNSSINIVGYDNGLTIAVPYIFDAGSNGSVNLTAANGYVALPPQLVFAGGSAYTINGEHKFGPLTAIVTTKLSAQAYIDSLKPGPIASAAVQSTAKAITSPVEPVVQPVSASDMSERVYSWQTTMPIIDNSIRNLLRQEKLQKDLQEQMQKDKGEELLVMNSCCTRKLGDQIPAASEEEQPTVTPVAYIPQQVTSNWSDIRTTNLDAAMLKYTADAHVSVNQENHLVLKQGETIVVATRPMTMQIGKCSIQLKAITIALLSKDHGVLRLSNLYDKQAHSVTFSMPCGKMDIAPGHEVMLAVSDDALNRYLNHDPTARRQFGKVVLSDGHDVATAEASLVSLFKTSTVLCALKDSTNAEDRAIFNKIMLMAACVMISTPGHGRYVVLAYDHQGR